ncbi:MAG: AraC family transcriptional regulator [Bacteroidales bacterium]
MSSTNKTYEYLIYNAQDLKWGTIVNAVGIAKVEPNFVSYPPKGHPEEYHFNINKGRYIDSYQLLYIYKGSGELYLRENKPIPIEEGDMILIKPGIWHSYTPNKNTGWTEYWIGFKGANIDNILLNNFFEKRTPVYKIGYDEEVLNLYTKALDVANSKKAHYQQLLAGIVINLLGLATYNDKNRKFDTNSDIARMNKARVIMLENIDSIITGEDIAKMVNMSYSKFRKLFKEYTETSPAQYIQELKLQKARKLLLTTNLTVKEIALSLNYTDISYFSTIFSKKNGESPKKFREKNRD